MKKVFKIEELDCAHCAAKIEEEIKKIDGVISATVNFLSQKLTIETEEDLFESVLEKAEKVCRKIEPDCRIVK